MRGLAIPGDHEKTGGDRLLRRARRWRCRDRDGRAGGRHAVGGGHVGLDQEGIESAGLLQRLKTAVADLREKRRVSVQCAASSVDHHAARKQVEDQAVARHGGLRSQFGR